MYRLLKQLLMFRIGQKTTRGFARSIGLKKIGYLAGIVGGIKYMRQLVDREFKDQPLDRLNMGLMAFAAYNCGPGRMRALRRETQKRGLDQNVWFNNVEQIVSERIGRETVEYVSNIYKYYIAYKLVMDQRQKQAAGKF